MIQIALYGKGGIGKSTISANLSAALAESGKSILQVGCDPKSDSTRLLLGGRKIPTVLDYLRKTPPDKQRLEGLLFKGFKGVACVETGGPKPGVGCAGRGILSSFEALVRLGVRDVPLDLVLYDVLGDVVCGGFAVPLRSEYADAVFLVTSGEFMAIYAANNILRGIKNFEDSSPRVAGIIRNSRGLEAEDQRISAFSKAVGLPVVTSIPRSEIFSRAEKAGKTLRFSGHLPGMWKRSERTGVCFILQNLWKIGNLKNWCSEGSRKIVHRSSCRRNSKRKQGVKVGSRRMQDVKVGLLMSLRNTFVRYVEPAKGKLKMPVVPEISPVRTLPG